MGSKNKVGRNCVNVPEDLTLSILRRLPAKSLFRFKCVCKRWCSLFSDNKKLLVVSSKSCIKSVDFESSKIEAVKLDFPMESFIIECPENLNVIGCCDGLLCIPSQEDVILWNPCSGRYEWIDLGSAGTFLSSDWCFTDRFGLGYDYTTDDYKIVRLFHQQQLHHLKETMFQMYSLKADCWEEEEALPWLIDFDPIHRGTFGISVNGAIYWPVIRFIKNRRGASVLRFDLINHKFSVFKLPCAEKNPKFDLVDIGGRLCMVHYQVSGIDMWVMDNYCKAERIQNWIKLMNIPVLPPNLDEEILKRCYKYRMTPVFRFRNGEVLMTINMACSDGEGTNEFYLYNQEENTFKKFEIPGAENFYQQMIYTGSLIYSPLTKRPIYSPSLVYSPFRIRG